MNIVIVGNGKVGRYLAEEFCRENHDVTVIDNKPERLKHLAGELDVMPIVGNGISRDTLLSAGVDEADLLIAITGNDELNLLCCLLSRNIGAKATIARVRNPEYSEDILGMTRELGITMIVNPEQAAAAEVFRALSLPPSVSVESFSVRNAEIFKFKISEGSVLDGMPVKGILTRLHSDVLVCVVERGDKTYIPDGEFVLQGRDVISVTGLPKNITSFFSRIQMRSSKVRNVMVVGAGKVAYYLARQARNTNIKLTMIEMDTTACEYMAERFPEVTVIHGNGADQKILMEEGLMDMDAFVSLTGIDEENIILSMYAGYAGNLKTITKINRVNFDDMLAAMNLDTVVNPKKLTADMMIRYARAQAGGIGSDVETVHKMAGDHVEGVEFIVKETCPLVGIPLQKLKTRKEALVAMIVRNKQTILPRGSDVLEPGDHVVIITTLKGLSALDDILIKERILR